MRPTMKLVSSFVFAGVATFFVLVVSALHAEMRLSPVVLPNGWKVTPAGKIVALAGDMPLRVFLCRDGRQSLGLDRRVSRPLLEHRGHRARQNAAQPRPWERLGRPGDGFRRLHRLSSRAEARQFA